MGKRPAYQLVQDQAWAQSKPELRLRTGAPSSLRIHPCIRPKLSPGAFNTAAIC